MDLTFITFPHIQVTRCGVGTIMTNQERAQQMVSLATQRGLLEKRPCCICGVSPGMAHHEDYHQPNVITFLCQLHHVKRHRQLGWGYQGSGRKPPSLQERYSPENLLREMSMPCMKGSEIIFPLKIDEFMTIQDPSLSPPAFPGIEGSSGYGNQSLTGYDAGGNPIWVSHNQGLSKREWLVGKILPGIVTSAFKGDFLPNGINFGSPSNNRGIISISALAIAIADETLKQLEGGK